MTRIARRATHRATHRLAHLDDRSRWAPARPTVRRTRAALAVTVLTALLTGPLSAVTAPAARADPVPCPQAYPLSQVSAGQTGTGYTVETGTTPEPFSATVLGVVVDGIAPGVDMIMVQLSSDALTRAGGVWEGMSGSPVYATDGRLIGSVSYGMATPSTIAGLTPAEDLQSLLTPTPTPTATPLSASSTAGPASRVTVSSTPALDSPISAAALNEGFRPLALPAAVSGVSSLKSPFLARLRKSTGLDIRMAGASIPQAASSPSEITAGSNFAAAVAYGEVSVAGVGTTTFVCDNQAVAFGHPFEGLGPVEFTAHPATAVYVQPDPVNGPFKVANPGGPVGVIDSDRTLGLRAELGATPSSAFGITSSISADGAAPVIGSTTVVYQPAAPDIAAMHLESAIGQALDDTGGGTANLTITITGSTPDDGIFTLTRTDGWSDTGDIASAAADSLYTLVDSLTDQDYTDVTITGIDITGTVSNTLQRYRVTGLKVWQHGTWVTHHGVLKASAGTTVKTDLTLAEYRSKATIHAPLTVKIPAGSQGSVGDLSITDGADAPVATAKVTSFRTLLAKLSATPPSNAVAGAVSLSDGDPLITFKQLGAPVSGYSKDITLKIRD